METKPINTNHKLRNTTIVISVLILFTPFIFISNLYPFMRFGMFAEKTEPTQGIELFEVRFINDSTPVPQEKIAIPAHMLNYLIRNHYYKGQIATCIEKLYLLTNQNRQIEIYRRIVKDNIISEELILRYPNE